MFLEKLTLVLGAASIIYSQLGTSRPIKQKAELPPAPIRLDEVLSYQCAREILSLLPDAPKVGPLFAEGDLVFTSLSDSTAQTYLLVSNGAGLFSLPLKGSGINRVRFEIRGKTYFLSYLHGNHYPSRYYEFSQHHPPFARDEADFKSVPVRRSEGLLAHFEFDLHTTTEALSQAILEGKVSINRNNLNRVENCDHIARRSPALARYLKHQLITIQLLVSGPQPIVENSRTPASLAGRAF